MTKKYPLVSIIVPVYNAEQYISECIKAVLLQTMIDFELIIIDDGSTDSTGLICMDYVKQDNRIRYYKYKNGGVSVARNKGIEEARGKYTIFADADDSICENLLEVLITDVQDHDYDIVMAGFYEWHSEHCIIPHYGTGKKIHLENENIMKTFLTTSIIHNSPWSKLYKTNLVKEVNFPVGIAIAEDLYFNYLILKKCTKILIHDICLYKYKIIENSAMTSPISNKSFDAFKIFDLIYTDSLSCYNLSKESNTFILKNYLWQIRYIHTVKSNLFNYRDKIKIIKKKICSYHLLEAFRLLEKRQWPEFLIIKVTPFLYRSYISVFIFYQKFKKKGTKE